MVKQRHDEFTGEIPQRLPVFGAPVVLGQFALVWLIRRHPAEVSAFVQASPWPSFAAAVVADAARQIELEGDT